MYLDKGAYILLLWDLMVLNIFYHLQATLSGFQKKKGIFHEKSVPVCKKPLLKLPHLMIWVPWAVAELQRDPSDKVMGYKCCSRGDL